MSGLQKAILRAGSQVKLAAMLGITTQSVNRWKQRYKGVVPAERVLDIYAATGVTPHELRPDLHPYPSEDFPDFRRLIHPVAEK
jgi:DNA-binding transcriptional regulator YdaS (Cro superfamily)